MAHISEPSHVTQVMFLELAILKNGDIVSGSLDKTVKIWNVNGELKNTFTNHSNCVESVAILPNGDNASGSRDGRIIEYQIQMVKLNFFMTAQKSFNFDLV